MNVVLVRLSAMGDILHALPLARNLALAGHRVAWIVEKGFAPLVEPNPVVSRTFAVDTKRWRRSPFSLSTRRELEGLAGRIAEFEPDVVLDAQANQKSWAVGRIARAPRVVLDDESVRKDWTRRLSVVRVRPPEDAVHFVDRVLCLLGPLRVPVRDREPDAAYLLEVSVPEADTFVETLPAEFGLLHPGAGWANKSWGEERFAELASAVEKRTGIAPVVSWGPGDEDRAEKLARILDAPKIPPIGFAGLARIIRRARYFAAGDTGPLHLADALGVPTFAFFGPTSPARNGPYRRRGVLFFENLPCAPCNRRFSERKACLSRIGSSPASEATARYLSARA